MKTNQEKAMQSLMTKLDQLEMQKTVQLTPEEATLYRTESMDELPFEDHFELQNNRKDGD